MRWPSRALLAASLLGPAACAPSAPHAPAAVLLFAGTGTSASDVVALEALLGRMHLAYTTVTGSDLARIQPAEWRQTRLLIVPGGNFLAMGAELTPAARRAVRAAVQDGMNYLGICAGAFLAGDASYPSFQLTPGVRFEFYAAARDGTRKTAVWITTPDGARQEHYWEDGPQLSGWGAVAAQYPDSTPAVVDGQAGRGLVVLTGIHAEAPETWRRGLPFRTPVGDDQMFAAALLDAALHGRPLAHY